MKKNNNPNILFLIFCIVFFSASNTFSQDTHDKENDYTFKSSEEDLKIKKPKVDSYTRLNNYFYFSPFHVLGSVFQIGYERQSQNISFLFLPSIILNKKDNRLGNEFTRGFAYEMQLRFNLYEFLKSRNIDPSKATYNHLAYFSPYFQYRYIMVDQITTEWIDCGTPTDPWRTCPVDVTTASLIKSYNGGILFGMKIIIMKKVALDFYAGGGLKMSDVYPSKDDLNLTSPFWTMDYTGVLPKVGFNLGVNF